ncbi:MAG: 1-acyl-sn-glycerol-3-phosphate acyltransferase [Clostridiales bacterium]|nr:1-acyl-sn-glycerol-3-phosphate acyltransferase [Clostridiales bacterium]
MFRLILVVLFLTIFFLMGIVLCPIMYLVGLFNKKARDYMAFYVVKGALKLILFLSGTKATVKGLENIPKDRAVLYVGNHRSFFDIVLIYSLIPPTAGFVAKKEIKKVFPLAVWMHLMNCLFLDRSSPEAAIKMIHDGMDKINNGISIFIFPEGTRAKTDDEIMPFKEGSLKMAKRCNCDIVPVAVNNTSAILEDQFPKIKSSRVCIEFGEPIVIDNLSKEDKKAIGLYSYNIVKDMVTKNGELIKK